MGKTSIAATRAPRDKRAARPVRASSNAARKEPPGLGYLKLLMLLAMILAPWAGIAYVARLIFAGR